LPNVRIRGISSTAITFLLVSKGFRVVQASDVIRERLGIPFDKTPAEVTVKDSSEPSTLVVLGKRGAVEGVVEALVSELEDVVVWWGRPGLHTVVKARVSRVENGRCILELPGGVEGVLEACDSRENDFLVVTVVKPSFRKGERAIVSRELRVDGNYVSLIKGGGRIEFSEFIRDQARRAELSALAVSKLMGSGIGVRFRSNSQYAELHEIAAEIDSLLRRLREIDARGKTEGSINVIHEGESIALVYLASPAKMRLDELRSRVSPTALGHHQLKYMGLGELVDFAEYLLANRAISREGAGLLLSYVLNSCVGREFVFNQRKLDGGVVKLTPGILEEVHVDQGSVKAVFKRVLRSSGVYDGLGVEKKPGDVDYMVVETGSWVISHNYFRGGTYIGSYVNVNTPPDIGKGVVEYMDLEVDIIVKPGGIVEVVDLDKLEEASRSKLINEKLFNKALQTVESVKNDPMAHVYNPRSNQEK